MIRSHLLYILLLLITVTACASRKNPSLKDTRKEKFSSKIVAFVPKKNNPVFSGTGTNTWDRCIRERGFILFEDGLYKMWYTGYNSEITGKRFLGYATSTNGITWNRYSENPIFDKKWIEDMFVIKNDNTYYMYAEGENDVAHLLVSDDGIQWQEKGDLIILSAKGEAIPAPYGTPTIWIEEGKWYLFYERNDEAVWLAESNDKITWINVQDEPILKPGPETYDIAAIAVNQVVKIDGNYYLFYHATSSFEWQNTDSEEVWTSNVAMSTDLLHWVKYPDNPVVKGNHSSPILVFDGDKPSLYTMHPEVCRYYPR